VNISSEPRKEVDSHNPELRKILKNIENIKRDITDFRQTETRTDYNKILKRFDQLEQSILKHSKQLDKMQKALITSTTTKLTEKQRIILKWLIMQYDGSEVYTNIIDKISKDLKIPESTVRWNMRGLREADLIEAGTKDNKGIPVSLTTTGRMMADYSKAMD
jgi:DNA-binding transcriptional ArsR family regulator